MAIQKLFIFIVFAIAELILSSPISNAESKGNGFSVKLISRDSPESPFYDPSVSPSARLNAAMQRSMARSQRLNLASISNPASSPGPPQMINNDGQYLLSISIGTPPVQVIGVVDTGSDLIWTQCTPCKKCYNQRDPLFNPKGSSSYRRVRCNSRPCDALAGNCPNSSKTRCEYFMTYGDGSSTTGVLSADAVTLGAMSRRTIFGCGFDNSGTFEANMSGIIGLGTGPYSLISQLGSQVGGRFSYCLTDLKNSSTMNFGNKALVTGPGTVTTPLVTTGFNTFYNVRLQGFSVGGTKITPPSNEDDDREATEIDMVVDSGATLSQLPSDIYQQLENAVAKEIKLQRVPGKYSKLCYNTQTNIADAPIITVHFAGGDVKLNSMNTFFRNEDGTMCFTFVPVEMDTAIFGLYAQMNFLVGYDTKKKTLSFKPADCTQF